MFDLIIQTVVNAFYAASYLSLIAVGLVLIFGVMNIINFAHGELYMLGAYAVVVFYVKLSMPFIVAVAAGFALVGMVGILMERGLFRPLKDKPLSGLVASIGLLLILQALVTLIFGVRMAHVSPPTKEVIEIGNAVLPVQRLLVIVVAIALLSALWWFLHRTRHGWALRACAQDAEAARLQGISHRSVARLAMALGAGLAGVAGALTAPLVPPSPLMGHGVIVAAFIVIIVGGVGSLEGAVIAAVLYAFVHTFVTTYADGVIADIVGLGLMLLVLIIRPVGLFGTYEKA